MLVSVSVPGFVAIAALTLSAPTAPATAAPTAAAKAAPPPPRTIRAGELYSLRARRRFAAYLRMRLLELRSQHLGRAADAIEHRLSVDELLRE